MGVTDTFSSAAQRLLFTNTASGNTATALGANPGLTYIPGSQSLNINGTMTANSFVGSLTGRASSASFSNALQTFASAG